MKLEEASINRRVLIIDDNTGIHEDFKRILSAPSLAGELRSGLDELEGRLLNRSVGKAQAIEFAIASATQGEIGWRMAKEAREKDEPFAMAFVDMRMPPGWDGIETIERIWQDDPDLQVAICTAYSDYSWEEAFERLGRLDQLLILKKPFDPAEARQIAISLTHKWSLASYAASFSPPEI